MALFLEHSKLKVTIFSSLLLIYELQSEWFLEQKAHVFKWCDNSINCKVKIIYRKISINLNVHVSYHIFIIFYYIKEILNLTELLTSIPVNPRASSIFWVFKFLYWCKHVREQFNLHVIKTLCEWIKMTYHSEGNFLRHTQSSAFLKADIVIYMNDIATC